MSPNGDSQAPNRPFAAFAARLQTAAEKKGLKSGGLAAEVGLTRGTMARYWDGDRLPPSDTLITLSETLGVSPTWLIRGVDKSGGLLAFADEADWIAVEEFDLLNLTGRGKGEPTSRTLIRRDWLYLTLGESSGLWIARLLAPEPMLGLPVGAPIFCKDIGPSEVPIEGRHYIFYVNGGVVLARFSYRGDRLGEAVVTPADLMEGDNQHFVVARVLGALARPL